MASERLSSRPACLLVASGAAEGEAREDRLASSGAGGQARRLRAVRSCGASGKPVEAPLWKGSAAGVPGLARVPRPQRSAGALAYCRGDPEPGVSVGGERVPGWRPQVPPRGREVLEFGGLRPGRAG